MPKLFFLGEILLRLETEKNEPTLNNFKALVGGASFNVGMGVSNLGNKTSIVSVIPDNFIGKQIMRTINSNNSSTEFIIQKEGNQGIYFFERGYGKNQSSVSYNRAHSVFADHAKLLTSLDFGKKGDILHLTGISLLISDTTYKASLAIVKKARDKGMIISFDFNYRSKLGSYNIAKKRYLELVNYSSILFATKRDFTAIFGWDKSKTEREIFEEVFAKYPLKFIAHTTRTKEGMLSGLQTIIHTPKEEYSSEVQLFEMIERIGGGDAFVAGILDGFVNKYSFSEIAHRANSFAILKQSTSGDFSNIDKEQLDEFVENYDSEVSR